MDNVQEILSRNNLSSGCVYLLELIPLIEMIWADGKTQSQEITILQQFTVKHLSRLSKEAEGMEVVSVDEANKFIDRFLLHRPEPQLIADLKDLAVRRMQKKGDKEKNQLVIEHCIDIAAACVFEYPYHPSERIRKEEKNLIKDIIVALQLPDRISGW